ncbi:hypothetical protein PSHT_03444 [Puccinia striiformis]|uniref:Uncharacterized protein n=1 Tax=Puccinia striiformis TaxID=27350 RepID=A0A2S4WFH1_9BASI|nr:hypothetical protein PSHT_03444 [Puccinia striiformis]
MTVEVDRTGSGETRDSWLFPGLKTIDEERSGSEPNTTKKLFNSDDGEPPANTGCGDDESDNESSNGDHPQVDETAPATSISQILQNVDYVIQRITSSAAKRSEFAVWGKRLEYDGQSLIAGYGIRWNIKWQSRDCAYEAREVITKLLELEQSRHNREGGTHFFQEVEIRWSDWEMVKKLNDILRVCSHYHLVVCRKGFILIIYLTCVGVLLHHQEDGSSFGVASPIVLSLNFKP